MKNNIRDLFEDDLDSREKKKIEKFKRKEERKKQKEERRLEKLEDKIFANRDKLTRSSKYENDSNNNKIQKFDLTKIYKISLIITLFSGIIFLIYTLIKKQLPIFNTIIFIFITIGFTLTSSIQKKKERKISSIVTSILFILWMLLNT